MTPAGHEAAGGDRHWMEQALALAAAADGSTSPNPRVGCVVVREGEAVGRGFHRAPGLAHAEAMALDDAGYADREFDRENTCAVLGIGGGGAPRGVMYGLRSCMPLLNTIAELPTTGEQVLNLALDFDLLQSAGRGSAWPLRRVDGGGGRDGRRARRDEARRPPHPREGEGRELCSGAR